MKKKWIPVAIVAIIAVGTAAYFMMNSSPKVASTTPPLPPSTTSSSSSSGGGSSSVSISHNEFPILTTPPANPTIGYAYFNSTDRVMYIYSALNTWERFGNLYDGGVDEYTNNIQGYNTSASVSAVAQLRDIVFNLLDYQQTHRKTVIIDASQYDNGQYQGTSEIRIPISTFTGYYGEFYDYPIYKIVNADLIPRIYLGNSTTLLFTDQCLAGSTLYPVYDAETHETTYVKA